MPRPDRPRGPFAAFVWDSEGFYKDENKALKAQLQAMEARLDLLQDVLLAARLALTDLAKYQDRLDAAIRAYDGFFGEAENPEDEDPRPDGEAGPG